MTVKELKQYYKKSGYKLTLDYIRKQHGLGNITAKERAQFYTIITDTYTSNLRKTARNNFRKKQLDGNSSSSGGPTTKNFSSTIKKRKSNEKRK
jgi:hypothetical protein